MTYQRGFTLIEISIVLVIVALVAGGVLAGRSLIESAEIRKAIKEIDQWKSTSNTFKLKYGALPGDIANDTAGRLGFFTGVGTSHAGNQDGLINLQINRRGEGNLFWRHLYDAGMNTTPSFANGCPVTLDAWGQDAGATATSDYSCAWPPIGINSSNRLGAFAHNGTNYFQIVYFEIIGAGTRANRSGITPLQAVAIDSKADDGHPANGVIQAMDNGFNPLVAQWCCWGGYPTSLYSLPAQSGTSSQNYCLFTGGQTYNTAGTSANQQTCQLRFDME